MCACAGLIMAWQIWVFGVLNWIKILKFALFCCWKFGVAFNKMAIKKMLKTSLALVNHAQQDGRKIK